MSATPLPPADSSDPAHAADFPRPTTTCLPDARPAAPAARGGWVRVNRHLPCPVCGRPDWCGVAADGSAAACMRVEVGSVRRLRNGAWLHRFGTDNGPRRPSGSGALPVPPAASPPADAVADAAKLNRLMDRYRRAATSTQHRKLAAQLGLSSTRPLADLGVGWSSYHPGHAFPCRDHLGKLVGIQIRHGDGTKRLVRGSRQGLSLTWNLRQMPLNTPLVICEGASDMAACLDLAYRHQQDQGLPTLPWRAVGRPNWACGGGELLKLVRHLHPAADARVTIVADAEPSGDGRRGARGLADLLRPACRRVEVLVPKAKDLRERVASGLGRQNSPPPCVEAGFERWSRFSQRQLSPVEPPVGRRRVIRLLAAYTTANQTDAKNTARAGSSRLSEVSGPNRISGSVVSSTAKVPPGGAVVRQRRAGWLCGSVNASTP